MEEALNRGLGSGRRKRVLVTRSREQASELAARLEARGFEAVTVPTIALEPPASFAELDAGLVGLAGFAWVLFTSANAAEVFGERAARLGLRDEGGRWTAAGGEGERLRIAAIGPATARAVERIGRRADLVPEQAVAESLAEALVPQTRAGRTRMLLVRAESARDVLPERLRAAGAEVVVAPAYRNVVPEESVPMLRAMFATRESWPDAITFTSSSTAANLLRLLEAAGVRLPEDGTEGKTVVRASIGPITSETLRGLGYPPHVEAREATIESLVEALVDRLGPGKS